MWFIVASDFGATRRENDGMLEQVVSLSCLNRTP